MSFSFSAALNNLVGNTPGANVSNLVQCLNDLKTYINGNIDYTNLTAAVDGYYKTHLERASIAPFSTVDAATTYVLTSTGSNVIKVGAATAYRGVFYLDPSDWAAGARTKYLRLRVSYLANGTQSGQTATVGLYPVSSISGGVVTVGTVTAGSTVAFANPAVNVLTQNVSTDFAAPVAGYYLLGFATGAAWTASSEAIITVHVQVRQV